MPQNGMITVWMDVSETHEEEFNAWYDTEHLAEVLALDGVLDAHRYYNPHALLRYLVCYDTLDEHVERGHAFQGMLRNPSPWTSRIRKLAAGRSHRRNFVGRHDSGGGAPDGAIALVHASKLRSDVESQARRPGFGALRYRAFEEMDREGRFLEIFEFVDTPSAQDALPRLAAPQTASIEVYRRIGQT